MRKTKALLALLVIFGVLGAFTLPALAVVVKTVPWVASDPLKPHDTYAGKSIMLKGTADVQGLPWSYSWDFGDGSPVVTGTVNNMYAIEASHTYAGAPGQVFTARLTVRNTTTGENASQTYYVAMRTQTLAVETNVAIDEGLWYLHKNMTRRGSPNNDGYWIVSYITETPANLNAFFVNGHLETGAATNPYTETVQRGMRYLFTLLRTINISSQTYSAPIGTVNPDGNGNNIGIYGPDDDTYSTGIYIDAIVASGTQNAIVTTAAAGVTNIIGRTYKDIVQDMVDFYAYAQTDTGTWMGGWGYGPNNGASDNSVNQWAAIGLLGAQSWGIATPAFVITANKNSLNNTQATTANCGLTYDGAFAYTNNFCYFPWGPWGTTPAGAVQMVLDGIGRGNAQWDRTENYLRNNFCNTGNSSQAIRSYYYGLFSFTKAMLLTPGGGIKFLANQPGNTNPIDWYSAETSTGATCNGVARTLINDQQAAGNWGLHNVYGYHTGFSTAWAIIMLNRTVFESGLPVAVAKATPNPGVATQPVILDGAESYHQDSARHIIKWEWDLNGDGDYTDPTDATGVTTTATFALGSHIVHLRVTDDTAGTPKTAETTITVDVSVPPLAPTANAGGPYAFCLGKTLFLDGSKSVNPDDGQHSGGNPGDLITAYDWDLDGDGQFDDASGATPNVTSFFTIPVSTNITLRVTDNSAVSFPAPGQLNLTSTDTAQVQVRAATDPACGCVTNLAARAKPGEVQLTWKRTPVPHHYNIYRGTVNGGPYSLIGTTTSKFSTYLDKTVANGTTYYYVVREAALNGDELCQSNQASATPRAAR